MATVDQLLGEHRQLRCLINCNLGQVQTVSPKTKEVQPLRSWKAKKADLEVRVAELRRLAEGGKRGQRVTIQLIAEEELLKIADQDKDGNRLGYSYPVILERVRFYFPQCRTTTRDLAWYASKMRSSAIRVPFRPRAKNGASA